MDASEVTRRLRERAIYASFIIQRNRIDEGCSNSVRLQNVGVGAFDSSLIPAIKEGDLYTTPEEAQAFIDANACEPVIVPTRDAIYMIGQFYSDPITFFAAQDEISVDLTKNDASVTWGTFLVKFTLDGTPLWATRINSVSIQNEGPSNTDVPIVHVLSDSSVVLTGYGSTNAGAGNLAMYFYNKDSNVPAITVPFTVDRNSIQWIAYYNSDGEIQWATCNTTGDGLNGRPFITSDSNHNLYIQFYFEGELYVYNADDLNTIAETITNVNVQDIILLKYNSNGIYQSHMILSGTSNEYHSSIRCDLEDNLYVACGLDSDLSEMTIYGPPNYQPVSFSTTAGLTSGAHNLILKFSPTGSFLWGTNLSGSEGYGRLKMVIDSSNNLYGMGMYYGTSLNIYSQNNQVTPAFTLPNSGNGDMYVVKFTPTGTASWASRIVGTGNDIQPSIGIDSNNNIIAIGESNSSQIEIYDAGAVSASRTLTFDGLSDNKLFIIKYNNAGVSQWASFVGPFVVNNLRNDAVVAADGTIFVSTRFRSNDNVNFYDSVGNTSISNVENTTGNQQILLFKYNANGAPLWATLTSGNGETDLPQISI
jgi:hypothetical protein